MAKNKKILALMSGGVDSSTAAALLCEQRYDVSGVYLKFYAGGEKCWAGEMRDAARVAAKLNIPFQTWDVTKEYKKRVLKDFYSEYAAGRTPNPDVLCNSEIKFGIALEKAMKSGYDFVASGHYARLVKNKLLAGVDKNKDQSYFLWRLAQKQLKRLIFPLGGYNKSQVRKMAKKFKLHNAYKKDSQGVCFLGKINLKDFLKRSVKMKSGSIVDVHGNLLGKHDGLAQFTIGQRHGAGIGDGGGPYFVVGKDNKKNTLIVANEKDEKNYRALSCTITKANWFSSKRVGIKARVRYRGDLYKVDINGKIVKFKTPVRAVASGQSIVFYSKDMLIGGGIIDKVTLCKPIK